MVCKDKPETATRVVPKSFAKNTVALTCFKILFLSYIYMVYNPWRNDHNLTVPVLKERKKEITTPNRLNSNDAELNQFKQNQRRYDF